MAVPADTSPLILPGRGGVRRFKASDRAAAEELFAAQYPRLAGWVRRLVDDDDTAHEIASEAFIRLMGRWTGVDNPHAYLYTVATNLVRDHWRRTERERRAMRMYADGHRTDDDRPDGPGELRGLVDTLPERQRDAFLLHYYAGYAVREVAAMVRRPEGTVKSDLSQARAALRSVLDDDHE